MGGGGIIECMTDLLTTVDAAKLADVTVPTITRWVAVGKLRPAHKGRGLRGPFLFTKSEVDRAIRVREKSFNV